jgi:prepilin-type N-terminal cleavage/methylation domain-containing protein
MKKKRNQYINKKGFTLLEILLVIAAIGILAAIVLIAINPNKQIAQARDTVRQSDINTIQKALDQYLIQRGVYPATVSTTPGYICNTGIEEVGGSTDCSGRIDLRELVPIYVAGIPRDPQAIGTSTGYRVAINASNNKVMVQSVLAENKIVAINLIYSRTENGLYGKRYVNYYNDDVNFFSTASLQGDTNLTTQINNFTNNSDYYTWQWLGYFLPPTTGNYTFFTQSDDASHLWIGDTALSGFKTVNPLVNNGGLHGPQERSGTVNLIAGQYYPIRIMFGEFGGGDIMTVSFSGPGISRTANGNGYFFGGRYLWDILIGNV